MCLSFDSSDDGGSSCFLSTTIASGRGWEVGQLSSGQGSEAGHDWRYGYTYCVKKGLTTDPTKMPTMVPTASPTLPLPGIMPFMAATQESNSKAAVPSLLVPLPVSDASAADVEDAFTSPDVRLALGASIAEGLRSSGIPSLADDDVEVLHVNVMEFRRRAAALAEAADPGARRAASSTMALQVDFQIRAASSAVAGLDAAALEAGITSLGKANSPGAQGFATSLGPNLMAAAAKEDKFASLLEVVGEEWTSEPPVPKVLVSKVEHTTDEPSKSKDGGDDIWTGAGAMTGGFAVALSIGLCCTFVGLRGIRARSSAQVLPATAPAKQPQLKSKTSVVAGVPCDFAHIHVEPEQLEEGLAFGATFVKAPVVHVVAESPLGASFMKSTIANIIEANALECGLLFSPVQMEEDRLQAGSRLDASVAKGTADAVEAESPETNARDARPSTSSIPEPPSECPAVLDGFIAPAGLSVVEWVDL